MFGENYFQLYKIYYKESIKALHKKNFNQFLSTTTNAKPVFSNISAQHSRKSRSSGEEIADVMSRADFEDASVRESRL